jgi:hypothetical protein
MAAELIVQGVPSNIILPPGAKPLAEVHGDVYGICERLREYDPSIRVVPVEDGGDGIHFIIAEVGADGDLREIMPVRQLDASIIERLKYLASVPVAQRLAEIQKQLDAEKVAREAEQAGLLYEKIGGPMRTAIFTGGFSQLPDPTSRRPLNATAKRAGRHA